MRVVGVYPALSPVYRKLVYDPTFRATFLFTSKYISHVLCLVLCSHVILFSLPATIVSFRWQCLLEPDHEWAAGLRYGMFYFFILEPNFEICRVLSAPHHESFLSLSMPVRLSTCLHKYFVSSGCSLCRIICGAKWFRKMIIRSPTSSQEAIICSRV